MRGIVRTWCGNFGFIMTATEDYFVPWVNAPADFVGRKYLNANEEVEFDAGFDRDRRACAVNISLLSKREPIDIYTYREQATVLSTEKPEVAMIARPFARPAILLRKSVHTFESNTACGLLRFFPGQFFEFSLRPPSGNKKYKLWECFDAIEMLPVEPEPTLEESRLANSEETLSQ